MALRPRFPICPVCNEPVELTTAKTTEDGQAIHEECYVETLKANPRCPKSYLTPRKG